jgi:RNase H-like domain found in reverse transcriptase/Reverse transcriptase (RNA-dependent DNA polymerase)/Integrase zinc binding domain/Chromo (CHRromatin Organisation MOdifier) domain
MLPSSLPPSRAPSRAPSESRSDSVLPLQPLSFNPPTNPPAPMSAAQKRLHEDSPPKRGEEATKRQFERHSSPQTTDPIVQLQDLLKGLGNQMLTQSTSVNAQLTAINKRMNQLEENASNHNSSRPPSSVGSTTRSRSRSHSRRPSYEFVERRKFEPTVEDVPEEDSRVLSAVPITPYQSTRHQHHEHKHESRHSRPPSEASEFHPPHRSFGPGQMYSDNKPLPTDPFADLNVPEADRTNMPPHVKKPHHVSNRGVYTERGQLFAEIAYPLDDEGYYFYSLMDPPPNPPNTKGEWLVSMESPTRWKFEPIQKQQHSGRQRSNTADLENAYASPPAEPINPPQQSYHPPHQPYGQQFHRVDRDGGRGYGEDRRDYTRGRPGRDDGYHERRRNDGYYESRRNEGYKGYYSGGNGPPREPPRNTAGPPGDPSDSSDSDNHHHSRHSHHRSHSPPGRPKDNSGDFPPRDNPNHAGHSNPPIPPIPPIPPPPPGPPIPPDPRGGTPGSNSTGPGPLVQGSVYKLNSKILGTWDPEEELSYQFINRISHYRNVYGDTAVVAAIPIALKGTAAKWFYSLDRELRDPTMATVDGWINLIKDAFPVDELKIREMAKRRRYNPDKDHSVQSYIFEKTDLLKAANKNIQEREIVDEVWLGLPHEIRMAFNERDVRMNWTLKQLNEELIYKDRSFRFLYRKGQSSYSPSLQPSSYQSGRDQYRRPDRRDRRRNRDRPSRNWNRDDNKAESPESNRHSDKSSSFSSSKSPADDSNSKSRDSTGSNSKSYDKDKWKSNSNSKSPWRKDDKGNWLKRPCRHCGKWHMDRDCPKEAHFFMEQIASESEPDDDDHSDSSATVDFDDDTSSSSDYHYHTATNGFRRVISTEPLHLKDASRYPVIEIPKAEVVGTGIAYLSAEPCPVRGTLGKPPDEDRPCITGVVDSGGSCIIAKDQVPSDIPIRESPLNPQFEGIGRKSAGTIGYAVVPTYLPNLAALKGDRRAAKVLLLWIEYQVVEQCRTGFLIGRDALKAYSIDIQESIGNILIHHQGQEFKIPISEGSRVGIKHHHDARVLLARDVNVHPFTEAWLPIKFKSTDDQSTLLFSPKRFINSDEGSHGSALYSLFSNSTNRLLFLNMSSRPLRLCKGEVLGTFEPVAPNSRMGYFNQAHFSTTLSSTTPPSPSTPHSSPASPPPAAEPSPGTSATSLPVGEPPSDPSHSKFDDLSMDDPIFDPIPEFSRKVRRYCKKHGSFPPDYAVKHLGHESQHSYLQSLHEPTPLKNATPDMDPKRVTVEDVEEVDPFGLSDEDADGDVAPPKTEKDGTFQDGDLNWNINPRLRLRNKIRLLELLRKKKSVFSGPKGDNLGKLTTKKMKILADYRKMKSSTAYRTSPRKRRLIREAIEKLHRLNVIRPSDSPVASPVVVVMQKGRPRFCVDLRQVNELTEADRYAIPHQDNIFASLIGALFFSHLDMNKGYHQVELDEESRKLTAFITEEFGLWEYLRVPFGLKNAPSFFQRIMDELLARYRFDFVLAYLDDIVIFSKTFDEHLQHIEVVLDVLSSVGLTLSESKCHWAYESINLLGHKVSRFGLSTQREKVRAILEMNYPETVGDAWTILGEFGYHRKFVHGYSIMAASLTDDLGLTKEEKAQFKKDGNLPDSKKVSDTLRRKPFPDTPLKRAAFNALKVAIATSPVLIHPDYSKPFKVYLDASRKGVAAAVYQLGPDDKEHPVLFISRTLKPAEKNYAATELECLAVVWGLKKLSHYLDGSQVTLVTDHHALKWIWDIKETVNQRLFRWSLLLNPLKDKVTIIHRPGKLNTNVDPLSRFPVSDPTIDEILEFDKSPNISKSKSNFHSSITHVVISAELRSDFRKGYLKDRHFRNVWRRLNGIPDNTKPKSLSSPVNVSVQTDHPLTTAAALHGESRSFVDAATSAGASQSAPADPITSDGASTHRDVSAQAPIPPTPHGHSATHGDTCHESMFHSSNSRHVSDSKESGPSPNSTTIRVFAVTRSQSNTLSTENNNDHIDSVDSDEHVGRSDSNDDEVGFNDENVTEDVGLITDDEIGNDDVAKEDDTSGSKEVKGLNETVDSTVPNDTPVDKGVGTETKDTDLDSIVPHDTPANKGVGTEGSIDRTEDVEEEVEADDGLSTNLISTEDITTSEGLYSLVNGLLYLSDKSVLTNLRLCVPESLISQILNLVHSPSHPGIRKTYQSLSTRFYFPNMSKRVKDFVNSCSPCQTSKPSNEKEPGSFSQPVESPSLYGHTISIDFVTGLPKSRDGFDALLSVTDKFTKSVIFIPCHETTTAEDVAKLFYQFVYPVMGLPAKIISDRDARFTSGFWKSLCDMLNIKLGLTAAYHPAADGQAERTNQIIETSLRCIIAGDADKYPLWPNYLPALQHELNSAKSETTSFSPNELRFITPPRSVADVLDAESDPKVKNAKAEILIEDFKNKRDEARLAISIAQQAQAKYMDARKSGREFEVGDLVLLKFNRKPGHPGYLPPKEHRTKIGPTSTPLRVIKKLSPLTYKLALPAGSQMHDVVSAVHLQKYGKDDGSVRPLPVIEGEEGKEEWEVEEILDHRLVKGKKEYLVRWKGYSEDETSWEPPEHLENAQELLLEFIAGHPEPATEHPSPTKSESRNKHHKKVGSTLDPLTMLYTPASSLRCRTCDIPFIDKRTLFTHLQVEKHHR